MLPIVLEFLALLLTGMLAGALMYCAHVEVGARKLMQPQEQLSNWRLAFPIAGSLFKPLSILATIILLGNGYVSGNWLWYVAAAFTFGLTPVTIFLIAPINEKLAAADKNSPDEQVNEWIKAWGMRHNIRSACTSIAFVIAIFIATF